MPIARLPSGKTLKDFPLIPVGGPPCSRGSVEWGGREEILERILRWVVAVMVARHGQRSDAGGRGRPVRGTMQR
jgi:hypothetical protein